MLNNIKSAIDKLKANELISGIHFKDTTKYKILKQIAKNYKVDLVIIPGANYHYCISKPIGGL